MNANAPIALLGAGYRTVDGAVQDFTSVWAARHVGGFHHTSVAVLSKDDDGDLQVVRSNNTAKHLEWGGAPLGAALFLLAPPAGRAVLSTVGVTGAGAMIDHFRHEARPDELAELAEVIEAGAAGLVVVALNRDSRAMAPLLDNAERRLAIDLVWGDLEEELSQDFAHPSSGALLVAI
jgi:hypothetical protein